MSKNYVHIDMYDDKDFQIKSEHGYVKDFDLSFWTDESNVSVRLNKEQAYALLSELREQLQ